MRRGTWIWVAVALMLATGCRKKADEVSDFAPDFSQSEALATGSSGDTMSKLAKQYDIPIYPNGVPDTSHFSATANMGARVYLAYSTADPPDRVVSFYKGQMGLASSTSGAVTILAGTTRNGSQIAINIGQKMDGSGTSFAIVVTPAEQPRYDEPMAGNPQTVATTAPSNTYQSPPDPAPKEPAADNTTYYIDRSNDVYAEDGGQDGGQADNGENGGAEYQDTGEGEQDNGPPGG